MRWFPKIRRPQYKPQYTLILIMKTPKMVPLILPGITPRPRTSSQVKADKVPQPQPSGRSGFRVKGTTVNIRGTMGPCGVEGFELRA